MKNLKLTEQMRDLVMLLTLAGVLCLNLGGGSESASKEAAATKRAKMGRWSETARRGPQGAAEGQRRRLWSDEKTDEKRERPEK